MVYVVPSIFDFDSKHNFFRQEIKQMKRVGGYESIRTVVNRKRILDIRRMLWPNERTFIRRLEGKIEVTFADEWGYDAGGLTIEWFTEIAKQMFNHNLGMFKLSNSGSTYYLNPKSYIHNEHLEYFKFIGRIIGKTLLEEQYIEYFFVKALYNKRVISWYLLS